MIRKRWRFLSDYVDPGGHADLDLVVGGGLDSPAAAAAAAALRACDFAHSVRRLFPFGAACILGV